MSVSGYLDDINHAGGFNSQYEGIVNFLFRYLFIFAGRRKRKSAESVDCSAGTRMGRLDESSDVRIRLGVHKQ